MSEAIIDYWWNDTGSVLRNAAVARPITLPDSWSLIQVGMLFSINSGSGVAVTGNARLYVGLCSGGDAIIGDITASQFIGVRTNDAAWTYSTGGIYNNVYHVIDAAEFVRKVGNYEEATADIITIGGYEARILGPDENKRTAWYFQISRSFTDTSQYWCRLYYNVGYSSTDYGLFTDKMFLRELQSDVPNETTFQNIVASNAGGIYMVSRNDLCGSLDHINIAWDREAPAPDMFINGVGVAVLA